MTITTHTAIGATLGGFVGGPVVGFVAGMLSHFLVDMIPHGDTKLAAQYRSKQSKKTAVAYVTIDGIVAIFVLLVFINLIDFDSRLIFTTTVAGSVLPDILVGLHDLTKSVRLRSFVKLHFFFHNFFTKKYGDIRLAPALIGQTIFILLLVRWM